MSKNLQWHLLALCANVLWGLMAPIGKSALAEFSPLAVTTFRMVGGAACFWLLSMFCKKEHVNHRDLLTLFFAALFALVFNQKEPVTGKKVLGIFSGAMGALILILSSQNAASGGGSILGDMLCLAAQISFSIYLTVFKGLSQRYSPVTLNKWMFVYASMCYIPFSYCDIAAIQWETVPASAILQVGYVVLGGTFVAYICLMAAQRHLRPTVVSMYNYMQPTVASIVAIAIGMATFNVQKGIAVVLVFLGVYFVTQSKSRQDFEKAGKEV